MKTGHARNIFTTNSYTEFHGTLTDSIHHHHYMSVMELGHLLTRSGLTYLEVSSEVCHDSFCQLDSSVSLPWVIYFEAFYLHVVPSSSCIPAVYLEPVLFLIPLQCVNLFCNLPKCILLFFSYKTVYKTVFADTISHTVEQKGGQKDGRGLHIRRFFC